MNNTLDAKRKIRRAVLAGLIIAGTISTTAAADETELTPFTMAVISNEAYGSRVESGKYEFAIDRITRQGRRAPGGFAEQVNLCVAYTKTGDIEKAGAVCDAAIARVEKLPKFLRNEADLALALSNRGVLLAAMGDLELAKKDFLDAIELQTRVTSIAATNLERLDRLTAS